MTIDLVVFERGYKGYSLLGDFSSDSDPSDSHYSSSGHDSDCILLDCAPRSRRGGVNPLMSSSESDVETFAEVVVRLDSHYNYDAYERDVLFFLVRMRLLNI